MSNVVLAGGGVDSVGIIPSPVVGAQCERQYLVKFGSFLGRQIMRWYSMNRTLNSIDYFESLSSVKLKGRIYLQSIERTCITTQQEQNITINLSQIAVDRSFLLVHLKSSKQIFLFESSMSRLKSLQLYIDRSIGIATSILPNHLPRRDYQLLSNQQAMLTTSQRLNPNNNNNNTSSMHFLEENDFQALMPESISQRKLVQQSQQARIGTITTQIRIEGCKPGFDDEMEQHRKRGENNEAVEEGEEQQYLRCDDEISHALSQEEAANTSRIYAFNQYYQEAHSANIQIPRIKRAIHSSNSSYYCNPASVPAALAPSGGFIFTMSAVNPSSVGPPPPLSARASLAVANSASVAASAAASVANGGNTQQVFFQRSSTSHIPRTHNVEPIMMAKGSDTNRTIFPAIPTVNLDSARLSERKQQYQQQQQNSQQLEKISEDYIPGAAGVNAATIGSPYQTYGYWSNSDIESESNLASIKYFICDFNKRVVSPKAAAVTSQAMELQNQFTTQTFFQQEFSTLLTMNTLYLKGKSASQPQQQQQASQYQTDRETSQQGEFMTEKANMTTVTTATMTTFKKDYRGRYTLTESRYITEEDSEKILDSSQESSDKRVYFSSNSDEDEFDQDSEGAQLDKEEEEGQGNEIGEQGGECIESKDNSPRKQQHPSIQNQLSTKINLVHSESLKKNWKIKDDDYDDGERDVGNEQEGQQQQARNADENSAYRYSSESNEEQHSRLSDNMKIIEASTRVMKSRQDLNNITFVPRDDSLVAYTRSIIEKDIATNVNKSGVILNKFKGKDLIQFESEDESEQNATSFVKAETILSRNSLRQSMGRKPSQSLHEAVSSKVLQDDENHFQSQQQQSLQQSQQQQYYSSANNYGGTGAVGVGSGLEYLSEIDRQSIMSSKAIANCHGKRIQKGLRYAIRFAFAKSAKIFEEEELVDDVDAIVCHVYALMLEFLFSMQTSLMDRVSVLCDKGIDVILKNREKKNAFLGFAQDLSLAELYAVKGAVQFTMEKKIMGLLSLKNAYSYFKKCLAVDEEIKARLFFLHAAKIDALEGIYHLAMGSLSSNYQKVLSIFCSPLNTDKGRDLLLKVMAAAAAVDAKSISRKFIRGEQTADISKEMKKSFEEYKVQFFDRADIDLASHIATISLALYFLWKEKDIYPVQALVEAEIKSNRSSPLYLWLASQIQIENRNVSIPKEQEYHFIAHGFGMNEEQNLDTFGILVQRIFVLNECKKNKKALMLANLALDRLNRNSNCNYSGSSFALLFEKACYLVSFFRWQEASEIFMQITLKLIAFEGFQTEGFTSILTKNRVTSSEFVSNYRGIEVHLKGDKIMFLNISRLLIIQAACIMSLSRLSEAKEWILLSEYFKKFSSLSKFLNNDMHELCKCLVQRKNAVLIKYEILYFTKTISKIPHEMIPAMLNEIESNSTLDVHAVTAKLQPAVPVTAATANTSSSASISDITSTVNELSSAILLRILLGYMSNTSSMIDSCDQALIQMQAGIPEKFLLPSSYLLHHSYYWIAKFFILSNQYDRALKCLTLQRKYPSKIFPLLFNADSLIKQIQIAQSTL